MAVKRGKYIVELIGIMLDNGPMTLKQIMKSGFTMSEEYLINSLNRLQQEGEADLDNDAWTLAPGVSVTRPVEPSKFQLGNSPTRIQTPLSERIRAPSVGVMVEGKTYYPEVPNQPSTPKRSSLGNGPLVIEGKLEREPYLEKVIEQAYNDAYVCWEDAAKAYCKRFAATYQDDGRFLNFRNE